MPEPNRLADIAVPVAARKEFTYLIPEELRGVVQPGHRVAIGLGGRKTYGYVVRLHDDPPPPALRRLGSPDPPEPVFDSVMLDLCRWLSGYYLSSLGTVLDAALPSFPKKTRSREGVAAGEDRIETESAPELVAEQRMVFGRLVDALRGGEFGVHLLHGVPGSGKTEIYMALASEILEQGGSVLLLEPEIGLATQMLDRVVRRFGSVVGLYHSMTGTARRREVWERTRRGEIRFIVGARSAVFAPLRDLRLVIVDEEQEPSYKQEESPRYHGRDVAIVRARLERALVILGTATPSLEAWRNVQIGKFEGHRLSKSFAGHRPPVVELVDLRADPGLRPGGGPISIFSGKLIGKIRDRLSRGEQSILFLNRRGHSTVVQCSDCGEMFRCDRCDVVLTYHRATGDLRCHHCGIVRPRPHACGACQGERLFFGGVGTQKLEEKLAEVFPRARILRLDTDSTRKRGSHARHLAAIEEGQVDILIGTQMIAKGFDFPRVTLVGVLQADREMAVPEFRSSERAFQILTQVAGRAGRGAVPGEVVFQTMLPDQTVIRAAAAGDYERFATEELALRERLSYPPFSRMAHLLFDGRHEDAVRRRAEDVANALQAPARRSGVDLLGPVPMFISRVKGAYRWHLTLKGRQSAHLHRLAQIAIERVGPAGTRAVRLQVDVDPIRTL